MLSKWNCLRVLEINQKYVLQSQVEKGIACFAGFNKKSCLFVCDIQSSSNSEKEPKIFDCL